MRLFVVFAGSVVVACSGARFSAGRPHPDAGVGGSELGNGGLSNDAGNGSGGDRTSDGGTRSNGGGATSGSGGDGTTGGATSGTGGNAANGGKSGTGGRRATGGTTASGGAANGGAGGTTSSGGGGAGGTSPVVDACPSTPPDTSVSSCKGNFQCSYGEDPRVNCRPLYECKDGTWLVTAAPPCSALPACGDLVAKPVVNHSCDTVGAWCDWGDTMHLTCDCVACTGTTCTSANVWTCAPFASPTSCPPVPPDVGQPCDANTPSSCTYGFCPLTESYVIARCKSNVWTWVRPVCP